jgi:small GTP-binding protein
MVDQPTTRLARLGQARTECLRLVGEANEVLRRHGRPPVQLDVAGKLRLAVMGQYNAGKSTLINALLGEKRAETGDAPTTRQAHDYELRDFLIADLPGGDARVEEQEEARRALARAQAVLYVVGSAKLDHQTVWDDLCWLERQNVPFLVVINDKQPHSSVEAEQDYQAKLREHFASLAGKRLRRADWARSLFWVQARDAEKARLEGKRRLEQASGILPLEEALIDYLGQRDELLRDLRRVTEVRQALRALQAQATAGLADDQAKALRVALDGCELVRERLAARAEVIASEAFPSLRDTLATALRRAVESRANREAVAEELTRLTRDTFTQAAGAFQGHCKAELRGLEVLLHGQAIPAASVPPEVSLPLGDIPSLAASGDADLIPQLLDKLGRHLPRVLALAEGLAERVGPAFAQEGGKEVLGQALQQGGKEVAQAAGREALQQGGKQAAGVSAKAVGRILGGGLMLLVAAWEIYSGWRRASQERAALEAALCEMEAKADLAATISRQEFLAWAGRTVAEVLAELEGELLPQLASLDRRTAEAQKEVAEVADLRRRLRTAAQELSTRCRE